MHWLHGLTSSLYVRPKARGACLGILNPWTPTEWGGGTGPLANEGVRKIELVHHPGSRSALVLVQVAAGIRFEPLPYYVRSQRFLCPKMSGSDSTTVFSVVSLVQVTVMRSEMTLMFVL